MCKCGCNPCCCDTPTVPSCLDIKNCIAGLGKGLIYSNGNGLFSLTTITDGDYSIKFVSGIPTLTAAGGGGGSGTVTGFSAGDLAPIFTTNVATPNTTPALTFALNTQVANTVFAGPSAGPDAAPTFRALTAADISGLVAQPLNQVVIGTGTGISSSANLTYDISTGLFLLQSVATSATALMQSVANGDQTALYLKSAAANREVLKIEGTIKAFNSAANVGVYYNGVLHGSFGAFDDGTAGHEGFIAGAGNGTYGGFISSSLGGVVIVSSNPSLVAATAAVQSQQSIDTSFVASGIYHKLYRATNINGSGVELQFNLLNSGNAAKTYGAIDGGIISNTAGAELGKLFFSVISSGAFITPVYVDFNGIVTDKITQKTNSVVWTLPTTDSTGTQALVSNGTGTLSWASFSGSGFANPMTTLGDTIYGAAAGAATRLAGDTSNTRKFLRELSVVGVATAPVWDTLTAGDIPSLSGTYLTIDGNTIGATSTAQVFTSGVNVNTINENNVGSGVTVNVTGATGFTVVGSKVGLVMDDAANTVALYSNGATIGWGIDTLGALYPLTDGFNIGLSGTNRIGTIYMASTIDYVSNMNFSVGGVNKFVIDNTGQVTTGIWTGTSIAVNKGGTGATTAAGARTALGSTTVGDNIFTVTNPSAITFLRVNANNSVSLLDAATFRTAIGSGTGSGTVTSVGFTGGIISVGTPSAAAAFTVAGTSGGIPYFSSTSTWASSGLLTASAIVLGGGAGASPTVLALGTANQVLAMNAGATANAYTSALSITSITLSGLTSGRVATISTAGLINDSANLTFATSTLSIGVAGSATGAIALKGSTSGSAVINVSATGIVQVSDATDNTKILAFDLSAVSTGVVLTINNANTASRTLSIPTLSGNRTLCVIDQAQTFTVAHTFNDQILKVRNPADSFSYTFVAAAIAANRSLNLPLITATDTLAVLGLAQTFTATQSVTGDFKLTTAGNGIYVKEGTNATLGVATLVAGTVTVSTTKVTASSRIFLEVQSLGTVAVATPVAITARSAGTSFTISSSSITDTSVIAWLLMEPA